MESLTKENQSMYSASHHFDGLVAAQEEKVNLQKKNIEVDLDTLLKSITGNIRQVQQESFNNLDSYLKDYTSQRTCTMEDAVRVRGKTFYTRRRNDVLS